MRVATSGVEAWRATRSSAQGGEAWGDDLKRAPVAGRTGPWPRVGGCMGGCRGGEAAAKRAVRARR